MMAGAAFGPVIGGLLLDHFWWGSVFLLELPVVLVLLVVGPVLLPEFRNPNPGRLDLHSAWFSLLAILSVIYGLKGLATTVNTSPVLPIASIVVGLIFLVIFVRKQKSLAHPLIDVSLFRGRSSA